MVKNSTSFKAGESGNLNGRPKGALNKHKKLFLEIQKKAAGKAQEAFNILWECIEARESWALQIFFKELYKVPKKIAEPCVEVEMPKKIGEQGAQVFLSKFIESLNQFESYTKDEILSVIKILNVVKLVEQVGEDKEILEFLIDEEVDVLGTFTENAKARKKKAMELL